MSQWYLSRLVTKPTKWLSAQRRLRSAWASTQSDQSLRCALNGSLRTQGFFMRTVKTLIRLGGCPGWSESSLGAQSFCWFCHEVAHLPSLWNTGSGISFPGRKKRLHVFLLKQVLVFNEKHTFIHMKIVFIDCLLTLGSGQFNSGWEACYRI